MDDLAARVEEEYNLLLSRYPKAQFRAEGRWFLVPDFVLPEGWNHETIDLVFQLPDGYPQNPPYGFYVPSGFRFNGQVPNHFTDPAGAAPAIGSGNWAFFSGNPDSWTPAATAPLGSNVLTWVNAIRVRLQEGA